MAGIRTLARRVDGGFLVNGSKTFITNGVRAHFVVTAVRTTVEGGHGGISFLVIERGSEGFAVSRKLEKLGWHASDTAELAFDDVFVPEENLLGEENGGFRLVMANFQWERLLMALGAVGGMERTLERAVEAAAGRPEFRHTVAEMAVRLESSRCLTGYALWLFASGHDAIREVTEAKLLSQRSAVDVAEAAYRVTSGDPDVARALRDARLGPIGGGTDEVMKEILGKVIGLKAADGARAAPRARRPAAVLVEVVARGILAVAVLVALDADPVEQVEEKHGGRGADEHRADDDSGAAGRRHHDHPGEK